MIAHDLKLIIKVISCILLSILLIIGYLMTRGNRHIQVFDQNAYELIDIIKNLEDRQIVHLNDIISFEWDHLYVFGGYSWVELKQEHMGINEQYLLNSLATAHDGTVYIYFLFENNLVARLFGSGAGYFLDFNLEIKLESGRLERNQYMMATRSEELAFLVIRNYLHDGREVVGIRLIDE